MVFTAPIVLVVAVYFLLTVLLCLCLSSSYFDFYVLLKCVLLFIILPGHKKHSVGIHYVVNENFSRAIEKDAKK